MTELEKIRSRVEALGMGFKFIRPIQTDMNGIRRETWLLEYEGSQFVYVAGQKNVTLGWDVESCPLGDGVLEGLKKDFAEGHEHFYGQAEEIKSYYENKIAKAEEDGNAAKAEELRAEMAEELDCIGDNEDYQNWEGYFARWKEHLSQCVSPPRAADIGDMLVEVDSRSLEKDAPSLEEAVRPLKEGPFTLATEDEWEYLYNGGARTLFRWGDRLSDVLTEIFQVGSALGDEAGEESVLNRPNMLGLFIGYDSYQCEIIDNASFTKGGDGGSSLCGGDGAIYVLPCYTAFYRHPADEQRPALSRNYYCFRRIIRLPEQRRIDSGAPNLIDLTLKITPQMAADAQGSEKKALAGHLGTHFDVMDKEFPLEYTERNGIVFDVSHVSRRDIGETDIDMEKVGKGMFVAFYTGFIEEAGYGGRAYFKEHPQLAHSLIDRLLEKEISLIGIDFAGVRRGKEHTPTDQRCADKGVFVIENLCNLKALVRCGGGFTACTYPMNYAGMTGLPCRVVARV